MDFAFRTFTFASAGSDLPLGEKYEEKAPDDLNKTKKFGSQASNIYVETKISVESDERRSREMAETRGASFDLVLVPK